MGCDIHSVFQRKDGDKWVDIASNFEDNRHYQLFAVLAGVRNGTGFAGIPTGQPVVPIAEPRGLPSDFEMDQDSHPLASIDLMNEWRRKYHEAGEPLQIWMGDHSFSWLTGEEMLAWFAESPVVTQYGVISRTAFETWDGKRPDTYAGDVFGPDIKVINVPPEGSSKEVLLAKEDWNYIRVSWKSSLAEELGYFFLEVRRLQELHGSIRFVFGFDS